MHILSPASSYKLFVHEPKSEDIIYLERYFLAPHRWPLGGLPWAGEPSESAAPVVAAARAAAELLAVIPAAPRGAGDRRGEPLPSGL